MSEPSHTQLEIGYRTIKTKFDAANLDYRQVLFGLPAKHEQEDEFEQFYSDSAKAPALTTESFKEIIGAYIDSA